MTLAYIPKFQTSHSVVIFRYNDRVWSREHSFDRFTSECWAWLKEHVGTRLVDWDCTAGLSEDNIFYFGTANEALLFKLTWGGMC